MNRNRELVYSAILAMVMLPALAAAPAPRATETQLSIHITPRAAELIAARERGMTPTIAPATAQPGSNRFFAQSCKAAGGNAVIARGTGSKQLVCV